MRFSIWIAVLLALGCSDPKSHEKPKESVPLVWHFLDQNHQELQLKSTDKVLEVLNRIPMPTLIMVLDLNPKNTAYLALFEHLQAQFKGVRFLALLNKAYSQEQIDAYSKANQPHFALFNPMDKTHFFKTLKSTSWPLPYFLLYDKQGHLVQNYRGVILEEMLAKDLQDLMDTKKK
ncbi:hypothetical protein HHE03_11950 [Helicobacter heilmannii]|uniref:TlpA family protein disulfide reductase n=1 Tax=Helicobacter heilmannii TaxID=35817 RepID=UPI0006A10DA4|nr:hypothetical protein [Helicobacter heilmannii]CRF49571.1 hypothetical protein HHE03_11950 [Helicobacter heilmannii]